MLNSLESFGQAHPAKLGRCILLDSRLIVLFCGYLQAKGEGVAVDAQKPYAEYWFVFFALAFAVDSFLEL